MRRREQRRGKKGERGEGVARVRLKIRSERVKKLNGVIQRSQRATENVEGKWREADKQ